MEERESCYSFILSRIPHETSFISCLPILNYSSFILSVRFDLSCTSEEFLSLVQLKSNRSIGFLQHNHGFYFYGHLLHLQKVGRKLTRVINQSDYRSYKNRSWVGTVLSFSTIGINKCVFFIAVYMTKSQRGNDLLVCNGFTYYKTSNCSLKHGVKWRCTKRGCKAFMYLSEEYEVLRMNVDNHNHERKRPHES
jgi:hypothetical protein